MIERLRISIVIPRLRIAYLSGTGILLKGGFESVRQFRRSQAQKRLELKASRCWIAVLPRKGALLLMIRD
jgi:hypothetical protein